MRKGRKLIKFKNKKEDLIKMLRSMSRRIQVQVKKIQTVKLRKILAIEGVLSTSTREPSMLWLGAHKKWKITSIEFFAQDVQLSL